MTKSYGHQLALLWLAALLCAGCSKQSAGPQDASAAAARERPAQADSDAAYYQERAAALVQGAVAELERTDFVRLRRGRLYAPRALGAGEALSLDKRLVVAAGARDQQATLDLSAKILADDLTHVHAHLARSVALRKLGRAKQADFHFAFARQLSQSILGSGDGKSAESAYTVFSEQEEHAVLKVTGYTMQSQALVQKDGRTFDVVTARKSKGGTSEALYFDVSELQAEQRRQPAAP